MKRHLFFFGTLFSKEVSLDDYTSYADTYQKGFLFANLMMQKATCFNTANTSTVARLFAAYPEYALEVMTKMPSLRFVDILNRLQQLHLNGSLRLDVNIDEYISKNEVWKSESLMNPPAAQSISKEVGPLYLFMTELIKRNHCAVVVDLVSLLSKDSSDESSTILFTGLEYQLQLDDREIYINKNNSRYTLKQNYQHRHG